MRLSEGCDGRPVFLLFYEEPFDVHRDGNIEFVTWDDAKPRPLDDIAGQLVPLAGKILSLESTDIRLRHCWYNPQSSIRHNSLICLVNKDIVIDDEKQRLLDTCIPWWLGDIRKQDPDQLNLELTLIPHDIQEFMQELSDQFVDRHDGKRISKPMVIILNDKAHAIYGSFAEAKPKPIVTESIYRSISGFDTVDRTVTLRDVTKKKEVIAIDRSKFDGQLEITINNGLIHELVVGPTKSISGKEIRELKKIGKPVEPDIQAMGAGDLFAEK